MEGGGRVSGGVRGDSGGDLQTHTEGGERKRERPSCMNV